MIPQLVTVRHRRRDGRWRRVWVPVVPILLVLSPLLILVALGGMVACVIVQVSPWGAWRGLRRLLCALPGTRIEVHDGRTAFLIIVR